MSMMTTAATVQEVTAPRQVLLATRTRGERRLRHCLEPAGYERCCLKKRVLHRDKNTGAAFQVLFGLRKKVFAILSGSVLKILA
jgi:hypothetical protein